MRLGLLVLGVCVVYLYFKGHFERRHSSHIQVQRTVPETLGPNDLRIYNADSTVDLILMGNSILAGLSPKMVAKVNGEMASDSGDTSGFSGSISQIVKKSVAGAMGTHAVFPVSEIRDIRYQHGEIVFRWKDGGNHELFGSTMVDGQKVSKTFRADDAQRFIDAVHARQRAADSASSEP